MFWAVFLVLAEVVMLLLVPDEKEKLQQFITLVLAIGVLNLLRFKKTEGIGMLIFVSLLMICTIFFIWYNVDRDWQPFADLLNDIFN
ncbi:hypothetical protein K8R42_00155 [bacterium]|nr:hypothetical protein [bacterium]